MCLCRGGDGVSVYVHVPVWLGFCYSGLLEKSKSDDNQTWVKDAIGVPSLRSKVM